MPQDGEIGTATVGPVRWAAGPVAECDNRSSQPHAHAPAAIHVIVRCSCGAAYMSTDAGIALGMAQQHTPLSGGSGT